jgi:4'-phosphopantetheinyl transferase
MPIIISKNIKKDTILLVWHITESLNYLQENVILNQNSENRIKNMKSESHQKGYLAVRMLLQHLGYSDRDLIYSKDGKPHLSNHKNISISHSFDYSSLLISNETIGIDIEKHKEKIKRIDYKFAETEMKFLNQNNEDYIEYLTVIWGVKEAVFKIMNEPGISFNDHISINPFQLSEKTGNVELNFNLKQKNFIFEFLKLENYSLVYIIS